MINGDGEEYQVAGNLIHPCPGASAGQLRAEEGRVYGKSDTIKGDIYILERVFKKYFFIRFKKKEKFRGGGYPYTPLHLSVLVF